MPEKLKETEVDWRKLLMKETLLKEVTYERNFISKLWKELIAACALFYYPIIIRIRLINVMINHNYYSSLKAVNI